VKGGSREGEEMGGRLVKWTMGMEGGRKSRKGGGEGGGCGSQSDGGRRGGGGNWIREGKERAGICGSEMSLRAGVATGCGRWGERKVG